LKSGGYKNFKIARKIGKSFPFWQLPPKPSPSRAVMVGRPRNKGRIKEE
jgi:hypothetical protein